ncbi:hypothetical protein ACOSQ3_019204 [Xanthoceras sorbifolium]
MTLVFLVVFSSFVLYVFIRSPTTSLSRIFFVVIKHKSNSVEFQLDHLHLCRSFLSKLTHSNNKVPISVQAQGTYISLCFLFISFIFSLAIKNQSFQFYKRKNKSELLIENQSIVLVRLLYLVYLCYEEEKNVSQCS